MTTTEDRPTVGVSELVLRHEWTEPRSLLVALWGSRELCTTLARRDFFVRYRRAFFGVSWAVVMPLLQAAVLAAVLSRVTRISVPHYPLFILSGIVAWTYFLATVGSGSTSIVDSSALSSRIYFPRAVLPLSVCLANLFALVISVIILLGFTLVDGVPLGVHTLLLLPAALLLFALTSGFTLVLSAAHVYFRDTRYAVQAALFVWFYITPVFYPLRLLHGHIRLLATINPVTGPVELFHVAAVGGPGDLPAVISALGWTAALLTGALVVHCRHDRLFADLL